jgi:hypothetical protein
MRTVMPAMLIPFRSVYLPVIRILVEDNPAADKPERIVGRVSLGTASASMAATETGQPQRGGATKIAFKDARRLIGKLPKTTNVEERAKHRKAVKQNQASAISTINYRSYPQRDGVTVLDKRSGV